MLSCKFGIMSCICRSSNFYIQLILLVFLVMSASLVKASEATPELVILNWSEYMDPEMVADFEKKNMAQRLNMSISNQMTAEIRLCCKQGVKDLIS